MGMEMKNIRWFSVMKILFLINLIPVKCASYCYYTYSSYYGYVRYYCYYYYYYYYYYSYYSYYSSGNNAGIIAGIVVGSVVGFIIFVSIVTIVCVKVCKKTNHGRVIVQPAHPTVSYINTTQHAPGGYMGYQPPPNPTYPPAYQGNPQASTLTTPM
ncbi:cysteine and tyrosine-rich protein 1-like isoform X2 [Ostrea edulis]|uniref:cysteine and tyrosine-rich protein 1-like isoform X2 n=1 Tax=Ostrea edulis TaxID=37623 RepID=UPI0024AF5DC9|nr:cysteine and tyrosine-rich protein 1-like isoform X2 [Ostrea edulis]